MRAEGLRVPVVVIPTDDPSRYFLRAGFRRIAAARKLRWSHVPAIVLPRDLPVVSEYWTNVVENSARDRLSSYEIAIAARTMRDKFGISTKEFALKSSYSESYVQQLLRCLDRLPPEIVEIWRERAPIPVALYDKWCQLEPREAVRAMLTYCGRHPRVVGEWQPPTTLRRPQTHPIKMASATGLARMQRLRFAVEVCLHLSPRERRLLLEVIDYCSGSRDQVAGVFDERSKLKPYKSRRRGDRSSQEAPSLPDPDAEILLATSGTDP
jgi:hypothetical protein